MTASVTRSLRCRSSRCSRCCVARLRARAEQPSRSISVQTNLVDKAIFEGEWWYSSTAIDVNYDEASIFSSAERVAPFEGSMSTDYGLDFNRSGPNVIGEPCVLVPDRAHPLGDRREASCSRSARSSSSQGGNDDGRAPDFRGQPLAVFKIEDHVDVRQDYNAITGEETNVTVENSEDRRWYERQFMRVDWSQNLITEFAANDVQANELFQTLQARVDAVLRSGGRRRLSGLVPAAVRARRRTTRTTASPASGPRTSATRSTT